ncbi:MAG: DUF87 domain-containing protein [Pirellulales bacterium]
MRRPESLWHQYRGKAEAELHRGSGLMLQPRPCELEPPWEDYDPRVVNTWDCVFNDWEGPWDGRLLRLTDSRIRRPDEPLLLPVGRVGVDQDEIKDLVPIVVQQFPEDEATIPKAQQFALAVSVVRRPVSFEILGLGPQPIYDLPDSPAWLEARRENRKPIGWSEPAITVQFVAHRSDAAKLQRQLLAHYPNSAVVVGGRLSEARDMLPGHDLVYSQGFGSSLLLNMPYVLPLKAFTLLNVDPLGVAVAAMEQLGPYEWALLQILYQPCEHAWANNARQAVAHPYQTTQPLFPDVPPKVLDKKFISPLFAAGVRLAALRRPVYQHLLGWAEQFAVGEQRLIAAGDENEGDFAWSTMCRGTFRPGILLNAEELASLVHLPGPSVVENSERLSRVKTRTRPTTEARHEVGAVVLGDNVHQGKRRVARIPPALRERHCYIAGASGTGKSTLLLNMILQDIVAGQGVGLLDPHGDLAKEVLKRIPTNRINDVILFDPTDTEYPFAFNVLDAKDEDERERIVTETIMALQRQSPSSWGVRLERILEYTLYTVLDAIPGATLADVERMITDLEFRDGVVRRTRDPRLVQFWRAEASHMGNQAIDPVLSRLSPFLRKPTLRNIIAQRRCAVDFDQVLNEGKILIANLSTGLLTEPVASTFGSFLVSKIINAAFRRAAMPENQRRPYYLYVDEFQAFMSLSISFDRILAEARKYKLVLAGLANQYVSQIDPAVRDAIFGNVGTFVTFRLGVKDATSIAKEMGVFSEEEILNLEMGQAFVRAGGSATAFNLTTPPPPPPASVDPTSDIRGLARSRYARPRAQLEKEVDVCGSRSSATAKADGAVKPKKQRKAQRPSGTENSGSIGPRDPSEDDLVN